MGKRLIISGENMTIGTGSVLMALQTAAAGSAASWLKILRAFISQSGTGTGQQVRASLDTRDTAGTLTTTTVTPRNLTLTGPAGGLAGNTSVIGGTARCGINSSADSGGTYTMQWPFTLNNLTGDLELWTPDEQLYVPPSTVVVVRLLAAPTTLTGWNVGFVYEELY